MHNGHLTAEIESRQFLNKYNYNGYKPPPLLHDRESMEKLLEELKEVCEEKEEMYEDTVADLK